jgi:hypothetical protein
LAKKTALVATKNVFVMTGKIFSSSVNRMQHLPLLGGPLILSGLFSNNVTRKSKMTKTLAILFAGLFATATFAQAPAAKKEEAKPAAAAPAAKKEEAKPAAKPAAKKEEAKPAAKKEEAKK